MNPLARGPRRLAFGLYAAVVVTLTHWPGLKIEGPVPRPDLFIHALVFGLWTLAAIGAEWFGPWRSPRAIAFGMLLSAAYAALDEWTQQFVGRVTTLDDFAANLLGVALAGPIAVAFARCLPRIPALDGPPSGGNPRGPGEVHPLDSRQSPGDVRDDPDASRYTRLPGRRPDAPTTEHGDPHV